MTLTSQSLGPRRLDETRRSLAFRHSIQAGNDRTLALDLQFARDGEYVSRRGPLPTFTRASAAWRINSAGVIVPAAINEARIDYDPTTLVCRGLPVEEQRTNLCQRSEDIASAPWSTGAASTAANQTGAPDGAVTADSLAETNTNAQHYILNASPVTLGVAYTASLFIKKGNGATAPDWVVFGFIAAAFGTARAAFNVQTGSFGSSTGITSTSVVQYPNGWWRITVTATAAATSVSGGLLLNFSQNANISASIPGYTGQTTSNVFVWGAQFEAGSSATSYIPTTSASVVRSADVCSITGSAFTSFYNQSEGTFVFRGIKQALQPAVTPSYIGVDDGTSSNRVILYGGSAEAGLVTVGGAAQAAVGGVTQAAALTSFAIALRYKANDFAFCLNGGTVSTDTSGTVPTVTQMLLGSRLGSNYMGGWIQSVQYYNRIKTDAQLQALSTP